MKVWRWLVLAVLIVGAGLLWFLFKPVTGPERDLTLVGDAERGTYLLRLGGCISCHTDLDNEGPVLAGGPGLTTPFGTFVPPNITSHPDAGTGGWTLAEFSQAMSEGKGPGATEHFYPAFPYDNYTLMSDQEIADLYAGLMATEPVAEPAAPHDVSFPFNQRLLMLAWKNLFFVPQRYEPDPERSDLWNRGRYLATGPGHCTACHTPRNMFGARDDSRHLEGAQSGTPAGRVPAIDPESLVAEGYDRAWLIDVLKGGVNPAFDFPGRSMGEVISEGTSHWTDEDLEAIAAYLLDED